MLLPANESEIMLRPPPPEALSVSFEAHPNSSGRLLRPDEGKPLPAADTGATGLRCPARARYLISVSILNIGRYMLMMITPTIRPTPIIISGSMIEVSDWIAASTSSS